ncbi:MAG: hypothetical protein ACRCU5_15180 [Rhizobiaceae bacterium]
MRVFLIIIGIALLLPGMCGLVYVGAMLQYYFEFNRHDQYDLLVYLASVPGIHLGCLGLWILLKDSKNNFARGLTMFAGVLGTLASLLFIWRIYDEVSPGPEFVSDFYDLIGFGFLASVVPFFVGALPALRVGWSKSK